MNKNLRVFPETDAEMTVYWFMYGYKYNRPPQHFNCRCVVEQIPLELESTTAHIHVPQPQPWTK